MCHSIRFDVENKADLKTKLLQVSLENVSDFGWDVALQKGCQTLGWSHSAQGMLKRGPVELVEYFIDKSRLELCNQVKRDDFETLKTTQKIKKACATRLYMTAPIIHRWPEALALMGQPENVPYTIKQLAELVDEIWFICGDKSVDVIKILISLIGIQRERYWQGFIPALVLF